MHEALCQRVEIRSRLGLGTRGGAAPHLAKRMEGASLDLRVRPRGPSCLLDAASSVADENIGRGDTPHETAPIPRVLASGEMAADDVIVGTGDENDAFSGEPDTVHVDDVVDLVANGDDRPYLPEVGGLLAEQPGIHSKLGLGELAEEPSRETTQPLGP